MQLPGRSRREALTRRGQGRHRPRRRGTGGVGLSRPRKRCLSLGGRVGWLAGRARGGTPGGTPPPRARPAFLLGAAQVYRAPKNAKGSEARHSRRGSIRAATNLLGMIAVVMVGIVRDDGKQRVALRFHPALPELCPGKAVR